MNNLILFINKNIALELSGFFIFFIVLISNLSVIEFAKGYFDYFKVSLALVDFTPQMYDYERITFPVLIASAILSLIVALLIKASSSLGEFIANKTKPNKRLLKYIKRHDKLFENLTSVLHFTSITSMTLIIILVACDFTAKLANDLGRLNANNAATLSSISKPNDNIQEIIIYKRNGEIITKQYDISKKKFIDGYLVKDIGNYQVRYIHR